MKDNAMMNIALIGCGNIAPQYTETFAQYPDDVTLVACADINEARAAAYAEEHGLRAHSIPDLLAADDIDIVLNLTIPAAHKAVSLDIIGAGKHVYSEKPLALTLADGREILDAAAAAGVRVGCAPDTVLSNAMQHCRQLIASGEIGRPLAATAFFGNAGPERWHPNPAFFYQVGGGPMLDMGPYYIGTLLTLLGSAVAVMSSATKGYKERVAGHEAIRGQKLPVETPTHYTGVIEFENGAVATLLTSFDVVAHRLPYVEVYCENGTLSVHDPNIFNGVPLLRTRTDSDWQALDRIEPTVGQRGLGVVDMARAIQSSEPHRASGAAAYHALEVMLAFFESGSRIELSSRLP